ncbi:MAG: D-cysteine desulfhydrase family protein [Promethearchaeota archaeon]
MKFDDIPRVKLASLPTPLEALNNLSKKLDGPQIFIKRDDMTGLATGGNKTRILEFILGDALSSNADIIVTGANPQSNFVRQTTAAVRKLGLDLVLVISDKKPQEINGNLLLTTIMGADIRFVGGHEADLGPKIEKIAEELRESGQNPYVIHKFGSVPKGSVAYVNAFMELESQIKQQTPGINKVVVSSAAGTYGGLCLGAIAANSDIEVTGIAISERSVNWEQTLSDLINSTAIYLGLDIEFGPGDINVNIDYFGEGYAVPTEGMVEAIKMVAQMEGVLLDPIYTGKGMAGLIDLIRKGVFTKEDNVVFWHTGGVPSLFSPQFRKLFI